MFKNLGKVLGIFTIAFLFFSTAKSQERPRLLPNSNCPQIVNHTYYSLCYLEAFEHAHWTIHFLSPDSINGGTRRTDDFRADPKVPTGSAGPRDFSGSGFDRGHLVPAGDMKLNPLAMSESFFMSNMSPQRPGFNRGIWRVLEEMVRDWALKLDGIYVVTAPVLTNDLETLPTGVAVPNWYYKILYAPDYNQMIAFMLPNQRSNQDLGDFIMTVDEIESITNIDFFSQLRDDYERQAEAVVDIDFWTAVHFY